MPVVRASTRYVIAGQGVATQSRVKASLVHYTPYGERTFNFPYAPVEVNYSGLARNYAEINRPGDFPLIEVASIPLMKLQMEFRVADPATNGLASIQTRLDELRLMGLLPGPIRVFNMDGYVTNPIAPTVIFYGLRLAMFRMTDLSVTIKRRNLENQPTQADVQLTLTEDRNPWIPTVSLPPINYEYTPTRASGRGSSTVGAPQGSNGTQTFLQVAGRG